MLRERRSILGALLCISILTSAVRVVAEEPRRGGSVTWFIADHLGRLDPHMAASPGEQQAVAGIYSSLLQYDPERPGNLIPDLAERWEVASEGAVYTFYLRQGVQWHDGRPFTAADVLATFTRLLAPQFRHSPCGALLQPLINRVEAVDDYTVRFQLQFPAASFLPTVASPWCRIVAKHILERDEDLSQGQRQIGTGPFILQQYLPGNHIEWARNPHYYDPRYPYIDTVTHLILPSRTRQLAAAKFGTVHLWATQPPMSYRQAQDIKAYRGDAIDIYSRPLNTVWAVHLNTSKPPFDTPAIRRAVHLALDRQALLDAAFAGAGVPCAILDPTVYGDWALPLEEVQALPGCRQPKDADLAEARRLVATAYPNGITIDIAVRAVSDYLERAQLVVAQLHQIGIRGRIKAYEGTSGWDVYRKGEFAMIGTQDTAMMMTDPSVPFSMLFASQARHNWSRWRAPNVDLLVDQGLRAQDPVERRTIYHELQRYLLTEDAPSIVIGWVAGWFFRDQRVRNYQPSPVGYANNSLMNVWLSPSEPETQERVAEQKNPEVVAAWEDPEFVVDDVQRHKTELLATSPSNEVTPLAAVSTAGQRDPSAPSVPDAETERPSSPPPLPRHASTPAPSLLPSNDDCLLMLLQEKPCPPETGEEQVPQPQSEPENGATQQVSALIRQFFPEGGSFYLRVWANKDADDVYVEGEKLVMHLVTDTDAYLQVDYYQANGQVIHLLPNLLDSGRVTAGQVFTLGKPENPFQFEVTPPFGAELLTVVASKRPLDTQDDMPKIEPADTYIERWAKRLKGYQTDEQVAVAYLRIRTRKELSDTP